MSTFMSNVQYARYIGVKMGGVILSPIKTIGPQKPI